MRIKRLTNVKEKVIHLKLPTSHSICHCIRYQQDDGLCKPKISTRHSTDAFLINFIIVKNILTQESLLL
jgi:hypothetical protein